MMLNTEQKTKKYNFIPWMAGQGGNMTLVDIFDTKF